MVRELLSHSSPSATDQISYKKESFLEVLLLEEGTMLKRIIDKVWEVY